MQEWTLREWIAAAQGLYFLASGVWPWISLRSFEKVTGPKTDKWLVRTAGLLVAVIGATLILAALNRRVTPEIFFLATGSACALAVVDVLYVLRGRISMIYLADAAAEAVLLGLWLISAIA